MAWTSAPAKISDRELTTGRHSVCTRIRRSPATEEHSEGQMTGGASHDGGQLTGGASHDGGQLTGGASHDPEERHMTRRSVT